MKNGYISIVISLITIVTVIGLIGDSNSKNKIGSSPKPSTQEIKIHTSNCQRQDFNPNVTVPYIEFMNTLGECDYEYKKSITITEQYSYERDLKNEKLYAEKALAQSTHNFQKGVAQHFLGIYYDGLYDPDTALKKYLEAITLAPEYSNIYVNLASIYIASNNSLDAENISRKCLEINSLSVSCHNNLGIALVLQGKKKEGINSFNDALKIAPDNQKTKNYLLWAESYK